MITSTGAYNLAYPTCLLMPDTLSKWKGVQSSARPNNMTRVLAAGCTLPHGWRRTEKGLSSLSQLLDYSVTKGAIVTMTKALAQKLLGENGIRVNAVAPGPVWCVQAMSPL